jgi:hypothetical protein
VFFERDDETGLESAAGSDVRGEGDEFRGKVLGLDGAGAAVAYDLNLRIGRSKGQTGAEEEQQSEEMATNIHEF